MHSCHVVLSTPLINDWLRERARGSERRPTVNAGGGLKRLMDNGPIRASRQRPIERLVKLFYSP